MHSSSHPAKLIYAKLRLLCNVNDDSSRLKVKWFEVGNFGQRGYNDFPFFMH